MVKRIVCLVISVFVLHLAAPSVAIAHGKSESAPRTKEAKAAKAQQKCIKEQQKVDARYTAKKAAMAAKLEAMKADPAFADRQAEPRARFDRKMAKLDSDFAKQQAKLKKRCDKKAAKIGTKKK